MSEPMFNALQALVWFLTSTIGFSIAIHLPLTCRICFLPWILVPAALSFTTVESLEPLVPEFDMIWCFTVVTYTFHITAILFIDQWNIPTPKGIQMSLKLAYKIWNNPRRLRCSQNQPRKPTSIDCIVFSTKHIGHVVLLWLLNKHVVVRCLSLLDPKLQNFAPHHQTYLPWRVASVHQALLRLFFSVHFIWESYLFLNTANAVAATVFVAILGFDSPHEWPPLFGNLSEAYTIRRFWSIFWHRILAPSHVSYGRAVAQRVFYLRSGGRAEKILVAFWVFTATAVTHTLVNWQTGSLGPLMGDCRFFMLNFVGGLVESLLSQSRVLWPTNISSWTRKFVGLLWVLGFFYCVVPPWQYAIAYD